MLLDKVESGLREAIYVYPVTVSNAVLIRTDVDKVVVLTKRLRASRLVREIAVLFVCEHDDTISVRFLIRLNMSYPKGSFFSP